LSEVADRFKTFETESKRQASKIRNRCSKLIDPTNTTPWTAKDARRTRALVNENSDGALGVLEALQYWCDGSQAKCLTVIVNIIQKLGLG